MLKARKLRIFLTIALGVAVAPLGVAQTSPAGSPEQAKNSLWENLRQLRPGQKIAVLQKDRKSWTGSFVSVSDEAVSLKAADGGRTVPRAEVVRVTRHGGNRGRNALIGAAAGGGAGAGIGAAAGGCKSNALGPCIGRGPAAGIVGAAGAVVGGALGAAFAGNTVVYRAPVK